MLINKHKNFSTKPFDYEEAADICKKKQMFVFMQEQ